MKHQITIRLPIVEFDKLRTNPTILIASREAFADLLKTGMWRIEVIHEDGTTLKTITNAEDLTDFFSKYEPGESSME